MMNLVALNFSYIIIIKEKNKTTDALLPQHSSMLHVRWFSEWRCRCNFAYLKQPIEWLLNYSSD